MFESMTLPALLAVFLAAAVAIWIAAAALAVWPLIGGGIVLGLLVLLLGPPLELRIREHARQSPAEADRLDAKERP